MELLQNSFLDLSNQALTELIFTLLFFIQCNQSINSIDELKIEASHVVLPIQSKSCTHLTHFYIPIFLMQLHAKFTMLRQQNLY